MGGGRSSRLNVLVILIAYLLNNSKNTLFKTFEKWRNSREKPEAGVGFVTHSDKSDFDEKPPYLNRGCPKFL